ncbi:MAG: GNAT family N-acetyltransferase [Brevundimonas sp.]|uniref:GNAT family N-acetyltransferase n=1 Tax=Brevundimonas sp. TaxID=1871086 RepID=UPI00391BAC3C
MTMRHIRPARMDDAAALSRLGRRTFIETFVEGFAIPYPEADLLPFLDATFGEDAIREQLAVPHQQWWVAEHDGQVAAFAQAGPNSLPHPEARPDHMELKRLYVARDHQGSGHGRALLETALAWMEPRSAGPLWIGVWSGNLRAQRLYGHYGFEKAGDYQYAVGRWLDDEFILRRL